jgi:hypothetical protein
MKAPPSHHVRRSHYTLTICLPSRSGIADLNIFAKQFTNFEWRYLSSYRWFTRAIDQAIGTGNFVSLTLRAEEQLVNEGLRRRRTSCGAHFNLTDSYYWF